jgi:Leucine-rich repeat (LRR) protein
MENKGNFIALPRKRLDKVIAEEEANGRKLAEEEEVDLIYRGIQDVDSASINYFKACKKLSLSSNLIQRIPEIQLDHLEILSIGRNKIK